MKSVRSQIGWKLNPYYQGKEDALSGLQNFIVQYCFCSVSKY
jgi:hypothetical protein